MLIHTDVSFLCTEYSEIVHIPIIIILLMAVADLLSLSHTPLFSLDHLSFCSIYTVIPDPSIHPSHIITDATPADRDKNSTAPPPS